MDLLTVTSFKGILQDRELRLEGLFPDVETLRANQFQRKKVKIHKTVFQFTYKSIVIILVFIFSCELQFSCAIFMTILYMYQMGEKFLFL